MEYEIEDEDVLFDDSTNPSLSNKPPQSAHIAPPVPPRRHADWGEQGAHQKGELIPEEESVG